MKYAYVDRQADDDPGDPGGDDSHRDKEQWNNYKTGADLNEDLKNLDKIGHNHRDGDFVWHFCKKWLEPLLGHVSKEKKMIF